MGMKARSSLLLGTLTIAAAQWSFPGYQHMPNRNLSMTPRTQCFAMWVASDQAQSACDTSAACELLNDNSIFAWPDDGSADTYMNVARCVGAQHGVNVTGGCTSAHPATYWQCQGSSGSFQLLGEFQLPPNVIKESCDLNPQCVGFVINKVGTRGNFLTPVVDATSFYSLKLTSSSQVESIVSQGFVEEEILKRLESHRRGAYEQLPIGGTSHRLPISGFEAFTFNITQRYHLAGSGSAVSCDYGTIPRTPEECGAAVFSVNPEGVAPGCPPVTIGSGGTCGDGAWGAVPLGCSAQGGSYCPHFKTSGCNCPSGYTLVCSNEAAVFTTCTVPTAAFESGLMTVPGMHALCVGNPEWCSFFTPPVDGHSWNTRKMAPTTDVTTYISTTACTPMQADCGGGFLECSGRNASAPVKIIEFYDVSAGILAQICYEKGGDGFTSFNDKSGGYIFSFESASGTGGSYFLRP